MKTETAVLLVSFGTSHQDAVTNSLDAVCRDLEEASGLLVYQAYTSGMIIKKLAGMGVKVHTVEEALHKARGRNVRRLYVISTHMIPGLEYRKLLKVLEEHRGDFEEIKTGVPVLNTEEDCYRLVPVLADIFRFEEGREYILMGHGTEDKANIRYAQMKEALLKAGYDNVHIASVEAKPDLWDVIEIMKEKKVISSVELHPFMVVAGDHAKNDMAGEEESYVSILKEEGFAPEPCVKGLGEYRQFRQLYVDKLTEMLNKQQKY